MSRGSYVILGYYRPVSVLCRDDALWEATSGFEPTPSGGDGHEAPAGDCITHRTGPYQAPGVIFPGELRTATPERQPTRIRTGGAGSVGWSRAGAVGKRESAVIVPRPGEIYRVEVGLPERRRAMVVS